ncbi:MAG TPA: hypothetical protein VK473_02990 [Terriglobales bacterium]|nr:hypothetical protein [Terriglobales bacterium]
MASFREARQRVQVVVAILIGVIVVAAVALTYFTLRSGPRRDAEFEALRRQVRERMGTVVPPDRVDSYIKDARSQIDVFYNDRIPSHTSAIFDELGALAKKNNVKLGQARYAVDDAEIPGLKRVQIEAALAGDYSQTMMFINALERDKTFFIVNAVTLDEQAQGTVHSGQVRLTIKMETYLRG